MRTEVTVSELKDSYSKNSQELSGYAERDLVKYEERAYQFNLYTGLKAYVYAQVNVLDGMIVEFTCWGIRIPHEYLELYLMYSKKIYSIVDRKIHTLKNSNTYSEIKTGYPNNFGVITLKSVQKWITYREMQYNERSIIDKANKEKKDLFLKSLEGQEITWTKRNESGSIIKNGIEFGFTLYDTHVSTRIELNYKVDNSIESFIKLADNKYLNK